MTNALSSSGRVAVGRSETGGSVSGGGFRAGFATRLQRRLAAAEGFSLCDLEVVVPAGTVGNPPFANRGVETRFVMTGVAEW